MYNRYIPQSDGTYCRKRVRDNVSIPRNPSRPARDTCPPPPPVCVEDPTPPCPQEKPNHNGESVGSFLRKLLPKGFDTGDLLIVILLLLMSGDCADDQNTALLTLAIYLFM